ncbi:hypothetical protein ABAC460_03390 [Asticcacaulis sp. AC460]|uniref:hypothetical protein n=1 Tax=Asticcacaulis sp. AC460 TaxID=1282360 RepID=UPI0003C40529|nr:hypothetical protein [Asticcacaulis sp. AC460]ESQ91955.1 hypothetical protein ABAC460_03390 [Asticcacaulis sp. AC460]
MTTRSAIVSAAVAIAVSFLPLAAHAQDEATIKKRALAGYDHMIAALEYEKEGKYHDACRYYTYARDELSGAILASAGVRTTIDLQEIQSQVDEAMARARAVCGKADEPS